MNWLEKIALSDKVRMERNIHRLEDLRSRVHDLGYFVLASNSGGFQYLMSLLKDPIVKGRPKIEAKLQEALIGENNQKIALDAPVRFQQLMRDAEQLVINEIGKEKRFLVKLERDGEAEQTKDRSDKDS